MREKESKEGDRKRLTCNRRKKYKSKRLKRVRDQEKDWDSNRKRGR